ncbi:MAG TPA: hypothetical protein VGF23_23255 [Gaiellaceae bacterium]|jgi:hypothetical protein
MIARPQPLLCELHAHTRWSDGQLPLREVVDLYGRAGFDVLTITDHAVRSEDPGPQHVSEAIFGAYLAEVEAEARRARKLYDLLVIPGLELTYNDPEPALAAHAVAVGLRSFVGVDDGLEPALAAAREHGAALVAAHPNSIADPGTGHGRTARFAAEWRELAPAVDRFELINRHQVYAWVADAGLPTVASGDFHEPRHLATWKTMLPCRKDEGAVIAYLRSRRPAYLVRLDEPQRIAA